MYFIINENKLCSLIIFLITATMVCPSPQTFRVNKYDDPNSNKMPPNIKLDHGFNPRMVVSATASSTARSINFNVLDVYGNLLIRVEPRMDRSLLGMNTLIGGGWGRDVETSTLQIKSDVPYCVHITYESNGYRIFFNGEAVYFYKHRNPNNATEFGVDGTGKVFLMSYKLNEPKWATQETENAVYIEEFGDDGIDTPYELQFQGTNQLSTIVITGNISANATSVEFNLMNRVDEILFHCNPRFTDNVVVRNSYIGGRWGQEERSGAMVFQQNQSFTFAIDVVEENYYKIYVNGQVFATYEYRTPAYYKDITKLKISRGIKLFKIIYHK